MEQNVVQNSATPNEIVCYPIGQESPASFMLAIQELGHRILNTSEEIEQRMADRLGDKSIVSTKKIWRLDTAAPTGPGGKPEETFQAREPEVVHKNARTPEIGRRHVENRPLAKPLITPSPFDGKTSWDDYQV